MNKWNNFIGEKTVAKWTSTFFHSYSYQVAENRTLVGQRVSGYRTIASELEQTKTVETLSCSRETNHKHSCAVAGSLLALSKLSSQLFWPTNFIFFFFSLLFLMTMIPFVLQSFTKRGASDFLLSVELCWTGRRSWWLVKWLHSHLPSKAKNEGEM